MPPSSYFHIFLILIFIAVLWLFYLLKKGLFLIILEDMRPIRVVYYNLLGFLGLVIAIRSINAAPDVATALAFIVLVITSIFSALVVIITNNIADYEIDKISNKNRPLIKSKAGITLKLYKNVAWASFFLALIYSLFVSITAFIIALFGILNYLLYSMPPLRLKRIPIVSKLAISVNSLLALLLGYSLIDPNLLNFPGYIAAFSLAIFTLMANFIDLKDYEGDKKAGIKTLPVLIGLRKSKITLGFVFFLSYASVFFIIREIFVIILFLFLGALQFYLINKKEYSEKPVFLVLLVSLAVIILTI